MNPPAKNPGAKPIIVRVASGNPIELDAVRDSLKQMFPKASFEIRSDPVELRESALVKAQPIGLLETFRYATLRLQALKDQAKEDSDLFVSIESGAITPDCDDGMLRAESEQYRTAFDVACVMLENSEGELACFTSAAVPIPELQVDGRTVYPLEVAFERGFSTHTAGQVINELSPSIPADNWHAFFSPIDSPVDRKTQIMDAFLSNEADRASVSRLFKVPSIAQADAPASIEI